MDVVIIGSGNVAHCFSHLLRLNGHQIKQVLSRHSEHARTLAEKLNTAYSDDFSEIDYNADVYLVAVTDEAISELNQSLRLGKRLVAHTAGAVDIREIENMSSNTGVMYPLQTLRKDDIGNEKIPLLIEGSSSSVIKRLRALGTAISDKIIEMDSARRMKMHLAAVFCNNFPNFLTTVCKSYCASESLDFELFSSLLEETYGQMKKSLKDVQQTGPAKRGDQSTMRKHEDLLNAYPEFKEIYDILSKSIQEFYHKN